VTPRETDPGRVLIIRVWFEPGSRADGFRARVISTMHIESHQEEVAIETSADGVLDAVRRWLTRVLAEQRP